MPSSKLTIGIGNSNKIDESNSKCLYHHVASVSNIKQQQKSERIFFRQIKIGFYEAA
jgi:hypothetical protein